MTATTNSLVQRGRTYGELLTELRARLSFVAQGPSAANNAAVLGSILREAHDTVYMIVRPQPMRKKTTITLEQGSHRYDWHNDIEDQNIDPCSVISIWIIGTDGRTRYPLTQGIPEHCWENTTRSRPTQEWNRQQRRYFQRYAIGRVVVLEVDESAEDW